MNNYKINKFLLKIALRWKLWYAKRRGWLYGLKEESDFVKQKKLRSVSYKSLTNKGIEYIHDTKKFLWWTLPWDYQFDSISTWQRGGADCNSLHRLIQVWLYNKGVESYLATYIPTDISKAHTTCIYKDGDKWMSFDYGKKYLERTTFKECVQDVNRLHKSEMKYYVVQDMNWKFVDL